MKDGVEHLYIQLLHRQQLLLGLVQGQGAGVDPPQSGASGDNRRHGRSQVWPVPLVMLILLLILLPLKWRVSDVGLTSWPWLVEDVGDSSWKIKLSRSDVAKNRCSIGASLTRKYMFNLISKSSFERSCFVSLSEDGGYYFPFNVYPKSRNYWAVLVTIFKVNC